MQFLNLNISNKLITWVLFAIMVILFIGGMFIPQPNGLYLSIIGLLLPGLLLLNKIGDVFFFLIGELASKLAQKANLKQWWWQVIILIILYVIFIVLVAVVIVIGRLLGYPGAVYLFFVIMFFGIIICRNHLDEGSFFGRMRHGSGGYGGGSFGGGGFGGGGASR